MALLIVGDCLACSLCPYYGLQLQAPLPASDIAAPAAWRTVQPRASPSAAASKLSLLLPSSSSLPFRRRLLVGGSLRLPGALLPIVVPEIEKAGETDQHPKFAVLHVAHIRGSLNPRTRCPPPRAPRRPHRHRHHRRRPSLSSSQRSSGRWERELCSDVCWRPQRRRRARAFKHQFDASAASHVTLLFLCCCTRHPNRAQLCTWQQECVLHVQNDCIAGYSELEHAL